MVAAVQQKRELLSRNVAIAFLQQDEDPWNRKAYAFSVRGGGSVRYHYASAEGTPSFGGCAFTVVSCSEVMASEALSQVVANWKQNLLFEKQMR